MKLILILIGIILILSLMLFIMFKKISKQKKQIKTLSADLSKQKENTKILVSYTEQIAEINKEKSKTDLAIQEAKTDEEVLAIVNNILANNNRLCNSSKE